MTTLYNFYCQESNGDIYYGQVASSSDPSSPYYYQPGETLKIEGGTYYIGTTGTSTSAAAGSVYCTQYYDSGTGLTYNSWHYDPASNQYYNISDSYNGSTGYNASTGTYYYSENGQTYQAPAAAGYSGLGSEYDYVKGTDGSYHVYGGGGEASLQITPSTTGTQIYDYTFMYNDGSYYNGTVADDGTFGYSDGYTKQTPYGTYTITGTAPSNPNEQAGYNYITNYYDATDHTSYTPYTEQQGTQYYGRPAGYGGLGTEVDYAKYATGYHAYGQGGALEASNTPALTSVPALT